MLWTEDFYCEKRENQVINYGGLSVSSSFLRKNRITFDRKTGVGCCFFHLKLNFYHQRLLKTYTKQRHTDTQKYKLNTQHEIAPNLKSNENKYKTVVEHAILHLFSIFKCLCFYTFFVCQMLVLVTQILE